MKILGALACAIAAIVVLYQFLLPDQAPAPDGMADAIVPQTTIVPVQAASSKEAFLSLALVARLDDAFNAFPNRAIANYAPEVSEPAPPKPDLSLLADYAYSEVPPDRKPAVVVEEFLQDIPVGTPLEEIKLVSDTLGLDLGFMKAIAKIESDFDPRQRTGSYIGLYQLSNYEFDRYGSGDIMNPRDNAIAAAFKFMTSAAMFELETRTTPTVSDLYLIHQQGTQGAAEHVTHPERVAWQSMCATDEGRQKGEKWCKRAIWQNTLPDVKKIWKSVENLTSGAFVGMWQQRVALLYSRYSEATAEK
jgi:hypothetical protein